MPALNVPGGSRRLDYLGWEAGVHRLGMPDAREALHEHHARIAKIARWTFGISALGLVAGSVGGLAIQSAIFFGLILLVAAIAARRESGFIDPPPPVEIDERQQVVRIPGGSLAGEYPIRDIAIAVRPSSGPAEDSLHAKDWWIDLELELADTSGAVVTASTRVFGPARRGETEMFARQLTNLGEWRALLLP